MKNITFISALTIAVALSLSSCKKDKNDPAAEPEPIPTNNNPSTPQYTVPTTYNFASFDFTATPSVIRLNMVTEITNYQRSTHTTTAPTQPTLSAQKLKDMFANVNNQFTDASLNTSGIQLKNKTSLAFSFPTEQELAFDDAQGASITAAANPTVSTASSGTKGKLVSPARAILVNANGFEYKEQTEKGMMGALMYAQAMDIINNISTYDNDTKVNGLTAQEQAWDEAFGYFGVPVTFPTSTVGVRFWGGYCNSVDVAINCNSTIMNAFLKGRAAISNKDNNGRDDARNTVRATWEKVGGAKCISYLKAAKNNLSDAATLHHNLSEGFGFVLAFRYNSNKTISDADINTLQGYFGTNLFNLNTGNLDLAIAKLESVFGLTAAQIP